MSMRKQLISASGGAVALAAFAALALVTVPRSSLAASASALTTAATASPSHDATDFSAARRRYYRRGPNAAGLAFMGMATGLIAGAIAEQRRREYYENYYYGPGPYYGPGYGYYGGPRYYYRPY
jgi:hypothetical protein